MLERLLIRVGVSTLAFLLCNVCLWAFLILGHTLSPEGFWQQVLVYGDGAYLLVGLQILGWLVMLGLWYFIWFVWLKE